MANSEHVTQSLGQPFPLGLHLSAPFYIVSETGTWTISYSLRIISKLIYASYTWGTNKTLFFSALQPASVLQHIRCNCDSFLWAVETM